MRWIVVILVAAFVASQIHGSLAADTTASSDCERWIIAIIPAPTDCSFATPAPNCQPPEGWEPVSGVVYGEPAVSGVLLRRCIEK
jgi:hypothetical protein